MDTGESTVFVLLYLCVTNYQRVRNIDSKVQQDRSQRQSHQQSLS